MSCETYQAVQSRLSEIERVTLKDESMPPNNPLSSAERKLLQAWISAGAPENPQSQVPPEEPLKATFDSIKKKLFVPKCLGCHSKGQTAAQVPLETREDLLDSPRELVIIGKPDESGLMLALRRADDKRMPPPPSSSLSVAEISVIHQWILEGAN